MMKCSVCALQLLKLKQQIDNKPDTAQLLHSLQVGLLTCSRANRWLVCGGWRSD